MKPVPLNLCDHNKHNKSLVLSSEYYGGGFPEVVTVVSHHTGREVQFARVTETSPFYDEDQRDVDFTVCVGAVDCTVAGQFVPIVV